MIKEKILEKIGLDILQEVGKILFDTGKHKSKEILNDRVREHALTLYKKNLDEELLNKYGNGIFYDDLCDVLLQNNNLTVLLERCINRDLRDDETNEEFIERISGSLHLKIYSLSVIKSVLYHLCDMAYISFNQLKDPENIMLKNIINTGLANTRRCISGIKDDTDKIASKQDTLLEEVKEIHNSILLEQKQKSIWENMGLVKPEDIEFLKSGNYNLKVMAKDTANAFCLSAEIKINYSNFSFEAFEEYISYLRFSGKVGEFEVCRLLITAHTGEVVQEYEDRSYSGMKIKLPDAYIDEVTLEKLNFLSVYVQIKPDFKYVRWQIENTEGEVLIPDKKYKIEREIKENLLYVYIKDQSDRGQLLTDFIFIIESINPWKNITKIQITQKDDSKVSSNLEFCHLLEKIKKADELISRDAKTNLVGFRTKKLTLQDNFLASIKVRKDFCRKLLLIENQFGLNFHIPHKIPVTELDNLNQIIDLIDYGVIATKEQEMTFTYEQLNSVNEPWQEMINTSVMFMFYYQKITIFDVEIPVTDYFKVVMFGKLTQINNKQLKLNCQKSYMFNERLATLPEEQIISNLSKGIMNITN